MGLPISSTRPLGILKPLGQESANPKPQLQQMYDPPRGKWGGIWTTHAYEDGEETETLRNRDQLAKFFALMPWKGDC